MVSSCHVYMANWKPCVSYEITKYVSDHPYYLYHVSILMNLGKWNNLPRHLQEILEQTAIAAEKAWPPICKREEDRMIKKAMAEGAEFYKLSPDVAKWYMDAAYETAWVEDAKRFPSEIVKRLKALLKKK